MVDGRSRTARAQADPPVLLMNTKVTTVSGRYFGVPKGSRGGMLQSKESNNQEKPNRLATGPAYAVNSAT